MNKIIFDKNNSKVTTYLSKDSDKDHKITFNLNYKENKSIITIYKYKDKAQELNTKSQIVQTPKP